MRAITAIALFTLKEGLRNRVLYGIGLIALSIIFLSIALSGLFMRDISKVLLDICLTAVTIGGLLVPFSITVTHLSGDIEKKHLFTLLCRPISRNQYILGKYLGLSFLTAVIMAALTGATFISAIASTYIYPNSIIPDVSSVPILQAILFSFISISVLNSCAFLWCSVTTSSFLSTLLILSTYIIGQTVEDIVRFIAARVEGVDISPAIEHTTHFILYIFPNLGAFDIKHLAAHQLTSPPSELIILAVYGLAYISIMLLATNFFFQKRDFT